MTRRDVFRPWNSFAAGSIMFAGGGGGGNSETMAQHAIAQNSAKAWNRYVETYVPKVETPYLADIMSSPEQRVGKVQGQVNADVAKAAAPVVNPAGGPINMGDAFNPAKVNADAQAMGRMAVEGQRLGAIQGAVDMSRGKQSTIDTGLEKLAGQQSSDAFSRAESDFNSKSGWSNALGSMSGVAANFASNGGQGTTNANGVQSWNPQPAGNTGNINRVGG